MNKKISEQQLLDNLSVVSHEIGTPICMISSSGKVLREGIRNNMLSQEQILDYIENIIANCDKISLITNNIMSVNSSEFIKYEYYNIREFIDRFEKSLKPYCEKHKFTFKCQIKVENDELSLPFECIERILLNLITNGVKYNDKKNKNIKLTISADAEYINFSVKDNGNGIPDEKIPKITDKFYRLSNTAKGMGLGLSIVKNTIDKSGGKLEIKSKLTKGTEVIFSIPLKEKSHIMSLNATNYDYLPSKSNFDTEFSTVN